jgi:hypothetical protein
VLRKYAYTAGLIALLSTSVAHANLISNGDFSQGLSDWTVTAASSGSDYLTDTSGSATQGFWFGAVGGSNDTISQSFQSIRGDQYVVNFTLDYLGGQSNSFVQASLGNTPFATFGTLAQDTSGSYSYLLTATSSNSLLSFAGRNPPSWTVLSNISVTQTSPVPEPSTYALMGIGLVGLLLCSKKKLQNTDAQV